MTDELKHSFASLLAERMKDEKLTARGLAQATGLSHPTIAGILAGRTDVTLKTLQTIARYLSWDPEVVGLAAWAAPVPRRKTRRKMPSR